MMALLGTPEYMKEIKRQEEEKWIPTGIPIKSLEDIKLAIEKYPEQFQAHIQEIGRTPETEKFLKLLNPDATEEQLTDFFAPSYLQIAEDLFPELVKGDFQQNLGSFITTQPDLFLQRVTEKGWSPDVEAFLRTTFPELTDVDIVQLFPEKGAITQEGDYIPENPVKDFLDELYLAGVGAAHIGKQFFLRTVSKELATMAKVKFRKKEYIIRWLAQQGDAVRREYIRSEERHELWMKNLPPELKPKPEYTQGVTDNWSLLKDPGYWGYSIAEALPYTLSIMAAMGATTYVTKNPYAVVAVGTAFATPMSSQDLYQDLIDNGASEEDAAELALPIGVFIGFLEVAADLVTLQLAAPSLKILRRNIQSAVVKQVVRWVYAGGAKTRLVRGGLAIFASEELTENLQTITQNTAVNTINENRGIFEGLDETSIQILIQTSPFAIFGGGMAMRYVSPSEAQVVPFERKQAEGWVQDNLTKAWYKPEKIVTIVDGNIIRFIDGGLTEDQAKLKALNEAGKTP